MFWNVLDNMFGCSANLADVAKREMRQQEEYFEYVGDLEVISSFYKWKYVSIICPIASNQHLCILFSQTMGPSF